MTIWIALICFTVVVLFVFREMRFFTNGRNAGIATRLSEDEAKAIAERAAGHTGFQLAFCDVKSLDERTVWHFATPTIGFHLSVTVDDETGEAHVQEFNGR